MKYERLAEGLDRLHCLSRRPGGRTPCGPPTKQILLFVALFLVIFAVCFALAYNIGKVFIGLVPAIKDTINLWSFLISLLMTLVAISTLYSAFKKPKKP